jgi:hypothetical protein
LTSYKYFKLLLGGSKIVCIKTKIPVQSIDLTKLAGRIGAKYDAGATYKINEITEAEAENSIEIADMGHLESIIDKAYYKMYHE